MDKITDILVNPVISVKQALKKMDATAKKILFVVDEQRVLRGTVTDGDIRRWILKGDTIDVPIEQIMNKNPSILQKDYTNKEAKEIMVLRGIDCIPIVDEQKRIITAIWWPELFTDKCKLRKAINLPVVIMAGGEGVRLSPLTNILPKSLMPIGGKPIIELIIDKFVEFGCTNFYLSINYKANILKAYFSEYRRNYSIKYIQEDKPLGTAGSLYLLKNDLRGPFIISNCDIFIEADYSDILKFHQDNKNCITIIVSMKHYALPYGICRIANGGILEEIQEKPELDFLVNTGFYIMESDVLGDIQDNTFLHMTDLINKYIKNKKKIGVYPVSDKSWLDMGQWDEFQKMLKRLEA